MLTLILFVFILIPFVLIIASLWVLYQKAGKPGWACIIPIYSSIIMLEIGKKPWWWIFLMMIPYVGVVWSIWSLNVFLKAYGKSSGYTVAVIFLPFIFLPMLAFSKDTRYEGNPDLGHPDMLDYGVK